MSGDLLRKGMKPPIASVEQVARRRLTRNSVEKRLRAFSQRGRCGEAGYEDRLRSVIHPSLHRLKNTMALLPPIPNELDITESTCCERASFGT
jgi:hypothetical protein